jgi:hypothetical protein
MMWALVPRSEGSRSTARAASSSLTGAEIVGHDDRRTRLFQKAPGQAAEERREARDAHGEDQTARAEHSPGLAQRHQALAALREVIERPHEQHGIGAGVVRLEPAGIAEPDARERMIALARRGLPRLLDVERHRVDEVHDISVRGEPARVGAGPAADVENDTGGRRKVTPEQLPRSLRFQRPMAERQALGLSPLGIVREDLGWQGRRAHGAPPASRFWKKWCRWPVGWSSRTPKRS